jgi:uncharacterized protein YbjT (DUF2867 family)
MKRKSSRHPSRIVFFRTLTNANMREAVAGAANNRHAIRTKLFRRAAQKKPIFFSPKKASLNRRYIYIFFCKSPKFFFAKARKKSTILRVIMASTSLTAAVIGGSGFLGRSIVRALESRGHAVRVAVRDTRRAASVLGGGGAGAGAGGGKSNGRVEFVTCDVKDPGQVEQALRGCDAVVNLPGLLHETRDQSFRAVHIGGAQHVAEACARNNQVQRMVHMSAIGTDVNSRADYARTKALGEAAVRAAFPGAVVLRPSVVFGPGDGLFGLFHRMSAFSPVLPLVGGGRTRFQPVFVDDVARAVVAVVEGRGAAVATTCELGGPEVLTFREMLAAMLRASGRRRVLLPVPFWAAEVQASILQRLFPAPLLTVDQVTMLRSDNVVAAAGHTGIGTFADLGIGAAGLSSIAQVLPSIVGTDGR